VPTIAAIQRILRHASVAVTQNCYIKTVDAEVNKAMQALERSLQYATSMHPESVRNSQVM
jgi:hypothetical protein